MAKKQREKVGARVFTGVAFEVAGNELVSRVTQRIAWHERHATQVDAELKAMVDGPEPGGEFRTDTMRRDLGKRLREHEQRASFLSFARDHLVRNALYRLTPSDLKVLDIMPDGYLHF